jgi:signal transduction histidine kinase
MTWLSARRLQVLLAAATVIPIAALAWLGVRMLQQDRELERQRQRERLEVAAGRVALEIERRLQSLDERLAHGQGVRLLPTGIEGSADTRILFQPLPSPVPSSSSSALASAEAEEYRRRDMVAAEAAYRRLASTGTPAERASALVNLGRFLRMRKDNDGALDAYERLQELGSVVVAGQPAGLIALQGKCKAMEAAGDHERLRAEVHRLARALESGEWPVDRATFELYRSMVDHWGGPPLSAAAVARTNAAIELWSAWRSGDLEPQGRRVLAGEHEPIVAVWTGNASLTTVWLATGSEIEALWRPLWDAQGLHVALSDIEGRRLIGTPRERSVYLAPSETRLPFMLSASAGSGDAGGLRRARVLTAGLVLTLLLMSAAAYALYRTTTRELALVRQQADFVAAVSHEFRTPLTSMKHLTELLVTRSVTSEERKTQYYELLAHETERLHRMVETLLSFGRMDVDAYPWRLEAADVDRIVTTIADDFRREPIAEGREVHCSIEAGLPAIRADGEALYRALWNLLENAGKYSNAGTPIHVFARRHGDSVLLGVRDEGIGIPPVEQRRIFQKFVRGAEATRSGVRGVGLGLALVTRIVEAHGGSVRLDSEPGRGSTFTLVLPCLES